MKKSCGYTYFYVDRYVYGELSKKEKLKFEAHLGSCEQCRRTVDEIKNSDEIIKTADFTIPDNAYLTNLSNSAVDKFLDKKEGAGKKIGKSQIYYAVSLAAACLLIFFITKKTYDDAVIQPPLSIKERSSQVQKNEKIDKKEIPDTPEQKEIKGTKEEKDKQDIPAVISDTEMKDSPELKTKEEDTPVLKNAENNPSRIINRKEADIPDTRRLQYDNKLRTNQELTPGQDRKKPSKLRALPYQRGETVSNLKRIMNLPDFIIKREEYQNQNVDAYLQAKEAVKNFPDILEKIDYWLVYLGRKDINISSRKLGITDLSDLYYIFVTSKPDPEIKKEALQFYQKFENILSDYYGETSFKEYLNAFKD